MIADLQAREKQGYIKKNRLYELIWDKAERPPHRSKREKSQFTRAASGNLKFCLNSALDAESQEPFFATLHPFCPFPVLLRVGNPGDNIENSV
jgi:hypothetical protein